jgi:hypothetical protein
VNGQTAVLMLTLPNTLGLFEKDLKEIIEIVHQAGALIYMDGANMNALMGIVRPGEAGVDIMHVNLHKTFSTPHGGEGQVRGRLAFWGIWPITSRYRGRSERARVTISISSLKRVSARFTPTTETSTCSSRRTPIFSVWGRKGSEKCQRMP